MKIISNTEICFVQPNFDAQNLLTKRTSSLSLRFIEEAPLYPGFHFGSIDKRCNKVVAVRAIFVNELQNNFPTSLRKQSVAWRVCHYKNLTN